MGFVNKTDVAHFDNDVLKSSKPVLVDFWAEWCGPCRTLGPILDEVANELGDKVSILKVNADDNPELIEKFGIRGIPTVIIFNKGIALKTLVGVQSKAAILTILEGMLE